jgi:uncharacterized protein
MEINLIKIMFQKLMEALRLREPPARMEPPAPVADRKTESFSLVVDGITIRGRVFFPSAHPARQYPTLIICHGIPGSGAPRPQDDPGYEGLAQTFTSLGIASVIFNFRGCGESGGNFDMMGWTRDLAAVLDRVLNTPYIDPTRVMLLGFSGGGAAAIYVAADNPGVYSMAVVGTPAHFRIFETEPTEVVQDFRKRGLLRDPNFPPNLEQWIDNFDKIEPSKWIAYFKGKHLLIVHGDADELIPVEHAQELFEHAPKGIAELSIIAGGAHRLRLDPRCVEILKNWFVKTVG